MSIIQDLHKPEGLMLKCYVFYHYLETDESLVLPPTTSLPDLMLILDRYSNLQWEEKRPEKY